MSRQHVEFLVAGTDKDSGEEDLTAIRPVADGEPAQAAVIKRPSENLRTRTEFIRTELENLKYLSDADRALILTGTGSVTWAGLPTGTFTTTQPITLKPFLAPNISTASRLVIGLGTASQITIRTRQDGLTGQPRAYDGANEISFDFTPVDTGTGAVVITVDGTPANNFHVQYDNNVTSGTLCSGLISALNGNTPFANAGLEAVMENPYPCVPLEYGFPTPPAPVIGGKVACSAGEQLRRFMAGAADAEKHNITQAHLTTFFAADGGTLNKLIEGDVLCLRYDDLVMAAYGGRRQSLDELPEDKADLAGLNLFLMRRFPERLPGALPFATVQNGLLIFVNGLTLASGSTAPLTSGSSWYQGSNANPNSWANSTGIAAGSFEDALDNVIQALGSVTAPSGAHVVGIPAITGTGGAAGTFSTSAGGIHGAISNIVSGANAHINLGTAAHAATAISAATVTASPDSLATITAAGQIGELLTAHNAHLNDTTAAHAATAISNTPNTDGTGYAGHNVSATTAQAAIDELDLKKATPIYARSVASYPATNQIINGNFSINQRQVTSANRTTAGRTFLCDRWYFRTTGTTDATATWETLALYTAPQYTFDKAIRIQRTSGSSAVTRFLIAQEMDREMWRAAHDPRYGSHSCLLQFWVRRGVDWAPDANKLAVNFNYGGTANYLTEWGTYTGGTSIVSPTIGYPGTVIDPLTTWRQYLVVFDALGGNATNVSFGWTPSGTAGANDWVEITGVQVLPIHNGWDNATLQALGTNQPPFTHAGGSSEADLILCQKYYETSYNLNVAPGTASAYGWLCSPVIADTDSPSAKTNGQTLVQTPFRVRKSQGGANRVAHAYSSVTGDVDKMNLLSSTTDVAAAALSSLNIGDCGAHFVISTPTLEGTGVQYHFTADCEI